MIKSPLLLALLFPLTLLASTPDEHWTALENERKAAFSNEPPASWNTTSPSDAEADQWVEDKKKSLMAVAETARAFYTQNPQHPRAYSAKTTEHAALAISAQHGSEEAKAKIDAVVEGLIADPATKNDHLVILKAGRVFSKAQNPEEIAAGVRQLRKEFPGNSTIDAYLYYAAVQASSPESSRELIEEALASNASDQVKEQARNHLKSLEIIGKTLDWKLTTLDGSELSLASLQGKVVLIDFWATWCGPCIEEIPKLKETYAKYKDQGFEIIGISIDQSEEDLKSFIKKDEVNWPQHFDKGSVLAKEYGITSIPMLWLVDKKGVVRDNTARNHTAEKIEKLLAE